VAPNPTNGLQQPSQIMVDQAQTVPVEKTGGVIGKLDEASLLKVSRSLALFLGFAG